MRVSESSLRRTGRRCYGMEIDLHYVALVLARWEAFTGLRAEKTE
jgi:DNA modification methylase